MAKSKNPFPDQEWERSFRSSIDRQWHQSLPFRDDEWWQETLKAGNRLMFQRVGSAWAVFEADWEIGLLLAEVRTNGYVGKEFVVVAKHLFGMGEKKAYNLTRLVENEAIGYDKVKKFLEDEAERASRKGVPYEPSWVKAFKEFFPTPTKPATDAAQPVEEAAAPDVPDMTFEPPAAAESAGRLEAEVESLRAERDRAIAERDQARADHKKALARIAEQDAMILAFREMEDARQLEASIADLVPLTSDEPKPVVNKSKPRKAKPTDQAEIQASVNKLLDSPAIMAILRS